MARNCICKRFVRFEQVSENFLGLQAILILSSLNLFLYSPQSVHLVVYNVVIVRNTWTVVILLLFDLVIKLWLRLLLLVELRSKISWCLLLMVIELVSRSRTILLRRFLSYRISVKLRVNLWSVTRCLVRVLLLTIGFIHLIKRCMYFNIIVEILSLPALLLLSLSFFSLFHLIEQLVLVGLLFLLSFVEFILSYVLKHIRGLHVLNFFFLFGRIRL